MKTMRLRRLLTLTLITNLITNTLLLTMVITVTVMWIKSTQPSEDPIEPAAMSLPHKVQQPTKTGDQRIPKGEEAPKKNTPEVKAQTADSREIHERLGIQPKVWERLSAREVVFTRKGTDREIAFRAYFLVRATPDKLFTLFTDYPKLPQLYEEVKKTVVLDRGQDFAVVYYRSKYLFFELTWVVKESFSADHR